MSRHMPIVCGTIVLTLLPAVLLAATAAPEMRAPATQQVAKGPDIQAGQATLPDIADTDIAAYPIGDTSLKVKNSEQGMNDGGAPKLKIKKFENRPILRFNFAQVPHGATITEAAIEIHMAGDQPLNHVGVYSLHVPWVEGTDNGKVKASPAGACFIGPNGVNTRWMPYPTGDFNSASGGAGGNATCVERAESLGQRRWRIPVAPYVIEAAMQNGQTLILCDETGLFTGSLSNAYFYSRETKDKAPVLKVKWQKGRDSQPPQFAGLTTAEAGPFPGSIVLELAHAGDDGAAGDALGYHVIIDGKELPEAMTPRPRRKLRGMLVRDLPVGKEVNVKIVAYDEAGNTATQSLKVKTRHVFKGQLAKAAPLPEVKLPAPATAKGFTATLADGLTLFEPTAGHITSEEMRKYADASHVPAHNVLAAVRGEILGLQCLIELAPGHDKLDNIRLRAADLSGPEGTIAARNFSFFREHYVKVKGQWIADVLPAITAKEVVAIPSQSNLKKQRVLGIYVDLLVPKTTRPGTYTGQIVVSSDAGTATCPLAVVVRDVTLPDKLSFIVEMNAYGQSDDVNIFHQTFRLCHAHRLSYNVLGYGHSRVSNGMIPEVKIDGDTAKISDWSKWDEFYGPLFSGAVTKGLPRAGTPASHWYLPFEDAWPYELSKCVPDLYAGRVAPDESQKKFDEWVNKLAINDPIVPAQYCQRWRKVDASIAKQFDDHFCKNGWTQTEMQIFNNHKYYFPSGSNSLWTMDEPQYGRDFRSLGWQLGFFDAAMPTGGMNQIMRGDVSRPELMGDRFDSGLEMLCVSAAMDRHPVLLQNFLATVPHAKLWWYGGGRGAEADPAMYIPLFINKWSCGADGGLPVYTSFGGTNDWNDTDPLRVVRFDPHTGMPVASFRMKAYRRAEQDMELVNMLAARKGYNRWHVRDLIAKDYPVEMVTISRGPDDPGYSTFKGLDAAKYDQLRQRLVTTLLQKQ